MNPAWEQGRLVANLRAALSHLISVNGTPVDPVPPEAAAFLAGIGCEASPAAVRARTRVEQQRLNQLRRTL